MSKHAILAIAVCVASQLFAASDSQHGRHAAVPKGSGSKSSAATAPTTPGSGAVIPSRRVAGVACGSGPLCQLPDTQSHGNSYGLTSDLSGIGGTGAFVAEDFSPAVSTTLGEVCWWGTYFDFDVDADCAPMAEPDNFTVTYYVADGPNAIPGTILAGPFNQLDETLSVSAVPTGILQNGVEVFEYSGSHAVFAVEANECYWVEVYNALDVSCVWLWSTAPPGSERSVQGVGPGGATYALTDITDSDMALCLDIPLADPADCFSVECSANALPEVEPGCGLPDDTTNGGCNMDTPQFESLACGDIYCGSLAYDPNLDQRDTDWYELVVTEPTQVSWCATGSSRIRAGIIDTGGTGNCADSGQVSPLAVAGPGGPACVTQCIQPGTWWLWVSVPFEDAIECEAPYTVQLACVPCAAAPGNDACDNALPIGDGVTPFNTSAATTDGGEEAGCAFPFGDQNLSNDVWFDYNSTCDGTLRVTTCEQLGGGATFDTRLAVYDSCSDMPACPGGSVLGCNDDDPMHPCGTAEGGYRSTVEVDVSLGNCYRIRLGGFDAGESGTGFLNLECVQECTSQFCQGDVNNDGAVDGSDFGEVFDHIDGEVCAGACIYDVDCDGDIDSDDSFLILDLFAGPCLTPQPCDPDCGTTTPGLYEAPPAKPKTEPCYCEPCKDGNCAGATSHGVYLHSGEFYAVAEDLRIKGRGLDFVWARKYRSQLGPDTAMGNGWDFSYNIWIEAVGPNIIVHDGNSRADTYLPQPDGSWAARQFFRSLSENPDGSFTLLFADHGTWNFESLDSAPAVAGKLTSIVDRTGNNALTFSYDAEGRLAAIQDALHTASNDRTITVQYDDATDLITSITDFDGRTVSYTHYADVDSGGSLGDLRSVISPAVTGTPTGNDFPNGKETVYTYSKGFIDDALNHDLLSITDPDGQTYLTVDYAHTIDPVDTRHTQDPANTYYDRCVRQVWGDPTDIIDYTYGPQVATVNDRMGNVSQHFFDVLNRRTKLVEYTGRADPNLPSDSSIPGEGPIDINAPGPPLRVTDPGAYTTQAFYNVDSQLERLVRPNLNEVLLTYDEANADQRLRGNMLSMCRLPGPVLGGLSDQTQICEFFAYGDYGGCGCGTNFVSVHTDARGHDTQNFYDSAGNLTQTVHRIPSIVHDYEYNSFGQLTAHTLPDNGTGHRRRDEFTYYDDSAMPDYGYLKDEIIDTGGFALTTTYAYDNVGNRTQIIDPRLNDTLYIYNALDQVVRMGLPEITLPLHMDPIPSCIDCGALNWDCAPKTIRYVTDTYYDANNNVVRVDVANYNELGELQSNTHYTTLYDYDLLNFKLSECQEVDNGAVGPSTLACADLSGSALADFTKVTFEYDANRNQITTRQGAFHDPEFFADGFNTVVSEYDERDLLMRETRAEGFFRQSTREFDYDGNANLTVERTGTEDAQTDPSSVPAHTLAYDGYDRVVQQIDAMGNVTSYHYDPNGNLGGYADADELLQHPFAERVHGELIDLNGGSGNIRLSEVWYAYDYMDRQVRKEQAFFDPLTQAPLQGGQQLGKAITTYDYSDNSDILALTDDNLNSHPSVYDSANRVAEETDAAGNTRTYTYDANGNVTRIDELHVHDVAGEDDQEFSSFVEFDSLNRPFKTIDNRDNFEITTYDSRNNKTVVVDAAGNLTQNIYDGLNRMLKTTAWLLQCDGITCIDPIVTTQTWDASSRMRFKGDGKGNETEFRYDALNRLTFTKLPDNSVKTAEYDRRDNVVRTKSPKDEVELSTYDLLNRKTARNWNGFPGTTSQDTTFAMFQYDGLSRPVSAEDDDTLVLRVHDSMGNMTSEALTVTLPAGLAVQSGMVTAEYDGRNNLTKIIYPGDANVSGRQVCMSYDELNRKSIIENCGGTMIASYDYVGPARVALRTHGNQTALAYEFDGITGVTDLDGDFGVQQVITTRNYDTTNGNDIDKRQYKWDGMYNKIFQQILPDGTPEDYAYDGVFRLCDFEAEESVEYEHDDVGNWVVVDSTDPSFVPAGEYTQNPRDSALNQYTCTPDDCRQYDANGNLTGMFERCGAIYGDVVPDGIVDIFDIVCTMDTASGVDPFCAGPPDIFPCDEPDFEYDLLDITAILDTYRGLAPCLPPCPGEEMVYDHLNQLTEYRDNQSGDVVSLIYDAFGRRVSSVEVVFGSPPLLGAVYYHMGPQVIEEQDDFGTLRTFVYGMYIDEPIHMRDHVAEVNYYYHHDDMYSVVAVTDDNRNVVERYKYKPFGDVVVTDNGGQMQAGSQIGNPFMFTGRRFDEFSRLYYFRARYLDPRAGRFITRDPLGIWGDSINMGNSYTYAGNNPYTYLDPLGLGWEIGVQGAIDLCNDFCTGKVSVEGSITAKVGYKKKLIGFVGLQKSWSGKLWQKRFKSMRWFRCGQCAVECEDDWFIQGGGSVSPDMGVLECSVDVSLGPPCRGSIGVGCEVDILDILGGPVAIAIDKAQRIMEKWKIPIKADAGVAGSFTVGICRGRRTALSANEAKGCLGGFLRFGILTEEDRVDREKKRQERKEKNDDED